MDKDKTYPRIRPTAKQQQAWDALSVLNTDVKILGFGGGAGGGKTWLACEWLLTLCYQYPNSRWFIGRQELTRLKKSTFVTFKKVCRYHGIPDEDWKLDAQNSMIVFKNGSVIDLLDVAFKPSDPDYERFGSLEYSGGFGEEAGEWQFDAFDILKSRISRHNHFDKELNSMCEKPIDYDTNREKYPNIQELPPKFLLTFNPSRGWLYRIFYKPWKDNVMERGYKFIQTLYSDNPYVAKVYGEQLDGIKNLINKARLKDGNWEYADDINAMTTLEHLQDMFSNTIVLSTEKYITVDVARAGKDTTVITYWQGLSIEKIKQLTHSSVPNTAQEVKDAASEFKVPYSHIAIDSIGVGGGVADLIVGSVAFNSNSVAFLTKSQIRDRKSRLPASFLPNIRTSYANLKTQCAFKLAELINEHKITLVSIGEYRDEVIEDLTATLQERDADKEGKQKMATKEEIKDELGRSPDIGDTMLMRMYFELKNDAENKDPSKVTSAFGSQQTRFITNIANHEMNSTK